MAATTEVQRPKINAWWDSFVNCRWNVTSKELAQQAERNVFRHAGTECTFRDTPVGEGPEDVMHSVSAGGEGPHVVCMPGYGAASGFYYKNVKGLAARCRLHLVDWLGTGLSGRPPFRCKGREESEEWFLSSLDQWRQRNGIDKMVLVGHSLGGYLVANYALKYPQHVEHVVLVCPAGISEKPADWKPAKWVESFWTLRGQIYRFAGAAWDWGVTPGSVARTMGPIARTFTSMYTHKRMGVPEQEATDFEPYFHQCLVSPGSGEYALRHLLAPFAWARAPMEFRMDSLQVPITFIYGEQDWMDPAGAHRVCKLLRETDGRSFGGNDCEVITIPKSGHFTFLEQAKLFNEHLIETIQPYITGVKQAQHAHVPVHQGPFLDESDEGTTAGAVAAAFVET